MRVFLDTVGLLSIWDKSDQWHAAAQSCFASLLAARVDLVTSSFVLLECGNAAARRPYRSAVSRLCLQLESRQSLILPTTSEWQAAWRAYENGNSEGAGIVDQVSFVIMRRMGITQAFTNDRHFRAEGFETLF